MFTCIHIFLCISSEYMCHWEGGGLPILTSGAGPTLCRVCVHQAVFFITSAMRRTSSGSDLANSQLFGPTSPTPYVYLPPSQQDSSRSIASPRDRYFRSHCSGGTIFRLPLQQGGAITLPGFTAEINSGFFNGYDLLNRDNVVFSLPTTAISWATHHTRSPSVLLRLCSCCVTAKQHVLVLDVDAPSGWLHWGPTDMAGSLRLCFNVHDVDDWIAALDIRLLLEDPYP